MPIHKPKGDYAPLKKASNVKNRDINIDTIFDSKTEQDIYRITHIPSGLWMKVTETEVKNWAVNHNLPHEYHQEKKQIALVIVAKRLAWILNEQ